MFDSQVETREDEEQSVKLAEILELLLAAGYFRARIKGLSPFDKVTQRIHRRGSTGQVLLTVIWSSAQFQVQEASQSKQIPIYHNVLPRCSCLLVPPPQVVGGMTWCITTCNFDIDVDLLFQENSTIGQKM